MYTAIASASSSVGGKARINRELVELGLQLGGEMYFHIFNVRESAGLGNSSL
jgi:hypothetical protein